MDSFIIRCDKQSIGNWNLWIFFYSFHSRINSFFTSIELVVQWKTNIEIKPKTANEILFRLQLLCFQSIRTSSFALFFLSIFAFFVWSLILFIFPSSPANPKDELQGNIYRKKWIGIFLQVIHQAWQFITSPSFTHCRFKLSFQLTFQMTFKIVKTKNENRSLLYNKSRQAYTSNDAISLDKHTLFASSQDLLQFQVIL